jgi:uncharacterized protein
MALVRFVVMRDAEEFARYATGLLEARIECNLLCTVLANVLEADYPDAKPVFAYGSDGHGEVRFAALRTPPWPMLASELDAAVASPLVAHWLQVDPELPGVVSLPETARAIAAAWSEQTDRATHCRMREAMHVLERVEDPPRPAPGRLRLPERQEHGLLAEWMQAFAYEAGVIGGDLAEAMVQARLARGALLIWDYGAPVSMVGTNRSVAGVVRLGPVYTPPEHRRRGYAGSAVAAVSRRALAHGARRCMLFTDLANPTSNKIYAEVGYRRIADWEEHAFSLTPASTG